MTIHGHLPIVDTSVASAVCAGRLAGVETGRTSPDPAATVVLEDGCPVLYARARSDARG